MLRARDLLCTCDRDATSVPPPSRAATMAANAPAA